MATIMLSTPNTRVREEPMKIRAVSLCQSADATMYFYSCCCCRMTKGHQWASGKSSDSLATMLQHRKPTVLEWFGSLGLSNWSQTRTTEHGKTTHSHWVRADERIGHSSPTITGNDCLKKEQVCIHHRGCRLLTPIAVCELSCLQVHFEHQWIHDFDQKHGPDSHHDEAEKERPQQCLQTCSHHCDELVKFPQRTDASQEPHQAEDPNKPQRAKDAEFLDLLACADTFEDELNVPTQHNDRVQNNHPIPAHRRAMHQPETTKLQRVQHKARVRDDGKGRRVILRLDSRRLPPPPPPRPPKP